MPEAPLRSRAQPLTAGDARSARYKGPAVPVFTNGTLVDDAYLDLFSRGGLIPVFSVEGDSAFTAERWGAGIHERVLDHSRELVRRGALFGFSVTLTSANADLVLSEPFLAGVAAASPRGAGLRPHRRRRRPGSLPLRPLLGHVGSPAQPGGCPGLAPLRATREKHGELTETRGGCALWNKKG